MSQRDSICSARQRRFPPRPPQRLNLRMPSQKRGRSRNRRSDIRREFKQGAEGEPEGMGFFYRRQQRQRSGTGQKCKFSIFRHWFGKPRDSARGGEPAEPLTTLS